MRREVESEVADEYDSVAIVRVLLNYTAFRGPVGKGSDLGLHWSTVGLRRPTLVGRVCYESAYWG